jgi:DNA-directed RNA polymerase specialized sigma24 family protein
MLPRERNEQSKAELQSELKRISRLLAIALAVGKKQSEQVILLSKAGLEPKEIAELIGTSANTVSVLLSKLRKEGKLKLPSNADDQRKSHDKG